MKLGEKVRAERLARGWSLQDLASRSGVEVGTISALEMRKSTRSQFAPQLARAFGMPLDVLLQSQSDQDLTNAVAASPQAEGVDHAMSDQFDTMLPPVVWEESIMSGSPLPPVFRMLVSVGPSAWQARKATSPTLSDFFSSLQSTPVDMPNLRV